jgi:hypothetical protein
VRHSVSAVFRGKGFLEVEIFSLEGPVSCYLLQRNQ